MLDTKKYPEDMERFPDLVLALLNDAEKESMYVKLYAWKRESAKKKATGLSMTEQEKVTLWNDGKRPKVVDTVMALKVRLSIDMMTAKEMIDAHLSLKNIEEYKTR
jgi:hypothetical protein